MSNFVVVGFSFFLVLETNCFKISIGGDYLIYSNKVNFPVATVLKNMTPLPQQPLIAYNSSRCGEALEAIPNPQGSVDGPRLRHLYCYSLH